MNEPNNIRALQYQVLKSDITQVNPVHVDIDSLVDGQVLFRIDSFALTANNATYAAVGEQLKYWSFFPVSDPLRGLVPVWGFATVVQSRSKEFEPGERAFGCWPMASHLVVTPGSLSDSRWIDQAEHRQETSVVYRRYQRLAPDANRQWDDHLAVLYPLLATSWLLNDFLADNDWFGAKQLIVASASSKTAIGLLKLAHQLEHPPKIVGLTSSGNAQFVRSLNCCDQVFSYEQIHEIEQTPSLFVDIAGNIDVREAVHHRLADNLKYSCAVGTSHWDKFRAAGPMPGAKPQFFFAPTQSEKRGKDWGMEVLAQKIDSSWLAMARDSEQWLTIERHAGESAMVTGWGQVVSGKVLPSLALMMSPQQTT